MSVIEHHSLRNPPDSIFFNASAERIPRELMLDNLYRLYFDPTPWAKDRIMHTTLLRSGLYILMEYVPERQVTPEASRAAETYGAELVASQLADILRSPGLLLEKTVALEAFRPIAGMASTFASKGTYSSYVDAFWRHIRDDPELSVTAIGEQAYMCIGISNRCTVYQKTRFNANTLRYAEPSLILLNRGNRSAIALSGRLA